MMLKTVDFNRPYEDIMNCVEYVELLEKKSTAWMLRQIDNNAIVV